ncbi:DPP IV N-terminal domain-containing protein [Actinomadura sp. NAK00032]|uniref:DPP IV N-terminal domain-containing protein n=1 Tax=Actinomadura sp. NAK00032 TaxID=2742128 RepID=UPI002676B96E|nr:DPP IV N-terminal domain-containing protein [Actinomadura sp. NAK00032]
MDRRRSPLLVRREHRSRQAVRPGRPGGGRPRARIRPRPARRRAGRGPWAAGRRRGVAVPCHRTPPANPLAVPSPDGKLAVSQRGHDLWAHSSSDGREWALTTDGQPDHRYGTGPGCTSNATLLHKIGLPHLPPAVAWSPDSTKVLAHRTDERGVRQTHLLEARPSDGGAPVPHTPSGRGGPRTARRCTTSAGPATGAPSPSTGWPPPPGWSTRTRTGARCAGSAWTAPGFAKLTDDDLDHVVTVSENKEYFIDSASTVDTPPVTRVRDWDFLVRELMGVQPTAHRPAAIPLDPESLGEMFA